jgi:hypothetical protein
MCPDTRAPTLTQLREDLHRWIARTGTYTVRELLTLHLLTHAEVTRSLESLQALRTLHERLR